MELTERWQTAAKRCDASCGDDDPSGAKLLHTAGTAGGLSGDGRTMRNARHAMCYGAAISTEYTVGGVTSGTAVYYSCYYSSTFTTGHCYDIHRLHCIHCVLILCSIS